MLLINPPLCKSCEPPAPLAYLGGALRDRELPCTLLDLNLECTLDLLEQSAAANLDASSTWTRRAARSLSRNLDCLRSPELYRNNDRYRRAVADINHLLEVAGKSHSPDLILSLANYQDNALTPTRSEDLIRAAESYRENIFSPYIMNRLDALLYHCPDDPAAAARNGADRHVSGNAETPGIVGISVSYLSQALTSFAIIGYLRDRHPEVTIVVGGGLITTWMRNPNWSNPFGNLVDHWVAGKGEAFLVDLLLSTRTTLRNNMLGRTTNSAETQDEATGTSASNSATSAISADSILLTKIHKPCSCPDYDQLADLAYLSPGFVLPYTTSRGCFWKKCNFCPEKSENNPYEHNPPEKTATELQALVRRHKPSLIHLLDNSISPSTLKALAAQPPGAPWYGFIRFDPLLADPAFCRRLKESGCVMLKLGLESGAQSVLDGMQKGINLELAGRILSALKDAGIGCYVYLLFGTPQESASEAQQTQQFTELHHQAISFLNLAIFNLPLNSPELADLKVDDFYQGDLSLYCNFEHPRGWGRGEIRRFLSGSFKKSRLIAPILNRDPFLFTSNHAPFLLM